MLQILFRGQQYKLCFNYTSLLHVNRISTRDLLTVQNLIRGRGLFCRAMMKSQMASPSFTPVYAALVAVVNTKFPEIGELLLKRVILQVREL